jgi:hypothetical protein
LTVAAWESAKEIVVDVGRALAFLGFLAIVAGRVPR